MFFGFPEWQLRLIFFFGVFVVMALAELVAPRRGWVGSKGHQWLHNGLLVVINTIAIRLVFPVGVVGIALWAQTRGIGLLNQLAVRDSWTVDIGMVIFLDFAIYLQHVVFHKVPVLWRLHRVHHAHRDLDVTSGVRFHTIEMLLSMGFKAVLVLALGISPVSVLLFEILLNATAMFNHSNVRLPLGFDRVLRLVLVTPDMHRIHHSIHRMECDSNYGFNLPWWDRLFSTYTPDPQDTQEGMTLGEPNSLERVRQSVWWMIKYPFVG